MRRRAFTLIELLVCLAVITLLTALIFAATGPGREQARRRVCASNLHQWGLAIAMYRADYDGRDPEAGITMTPAEMGLPPGSDTKVFYTQNHLVGPGATVAFCPDYRPTNPHYGSQLVTSYVVPFFWFDRMVPLQSKVAAERGSQYPLVVCEEHNAELDISKLPTWAKKNVQTLRIDQSITFKEVPASADTWHE